MGELEENLKQGHVKLHRSILENWIWGNERKSMFEAWVYILLKANWKPGELKVGYEVVKIKRGEFFTSQEQLGKAFRWDRSQVRKFLDMLKKESMVIVNATSKYTKITICKYESYQDILPTKDQQKTIVEPTPQHQSLTIEEEVNKKEEGEEVVPFNQISFLEVFKRSSPANFKDEYLKKEIEKFKKKYPQAQPNNSKLILAWTSRMEISDYIINDGLTDYERQMAKAR